jgi:hypothetical protein
VKRRGLQDEEVGFGYVLVEHPLLHRIERLRRAVAGKAVVLDVRAGEVGEGLRQRLRIVEPDAERVAVAEEADARRVGSRLRRPQQPVVERVGHPVDRLAVDGLVDLMRAGADGGRAEIVVGAPHARRREVDVVGLVRLVIAFHRREADAERHRRHEQVLQHAARLRGDRDTEDRESDRDLDRRVGILVRAEEHDQRHDAGERHTHAPRETHQQTHDRSDVHLVSKTGGPVGSARG